jgi:hypothetical protein
MPSKVTKPLVAEAVYSLLAENITPTAKLVREKIGFGSFTSILPPYQEIMEDLKASPPPPPSAEEIAGKILKLIPEFVNAKTTAIEEYHREQAARIAADMDTLKETLIASEHKAGSLAENILISTTINDTIIPHHKEHITWRKELRDSAAELNKETAKAEAELNLALKENEKLKRELDMAKTECAKAKMDALKAKEKAAKLEGRLEGLEKAAGRMAPPLKAGPAQAENQGMAAEAVKPSGAASKPRM